MKIIEQASVITDLIETANAIRNLLGDKYTVGVIGTDTDTDVLALAIADTDGDGGWIAVTLTGTPELVVGGETAREAAPAGGLEPTSVYCDTTIGSHPRHKFMRGRHSFQCPGIEKPAR